MKEYNIEDCFGELTFDYKVHKKTKLKDLERISEANHIVNYIWSSYALFVYQREVMYAIFLNRANKILGRWKMSEGSLTGALVPINMLFARALAVQASGIIIIHNHPSGNITPSSTDIDISIKLKYACALLDMSLIDSIIISPDKEYYSLMNEGKL